MVPRLSLIKERDEIFVVKCLRKLLGEGLESCSIEELQEIEQQLENSVSNIRARKVSLTMRFS